MWGGGEEMRERDVMGGGGDERERHVMGGGGGGEMISRRETDRE